ncbi:SDR family oxidoreductase [Labedella endophytica]|uniref:SDR family oxidoreductase n=1 Tax=Labedella endophytica TaxID=1523160 RepID=A0A433JT32_9MICO|nr:SDR family oxidoreductase [Labedella endophytica]RUR01177.1 SDR family oxidoreductase [Labedella endophytica]
MNTPDSRKIVLVTGASSGIGAATAERLASDGHHVVLAARRTDRLDALTARLTTSGASVESVQLDVVDHDAHRAVVDAIVTEHGRLDVLVANAGVMPLSRLDAGLVDEWRRMVDVNVMGLLNGIAASLPHFTRQGSGHLVTIASIGAHEVPPTSAVYSGTKFAAWAITEGLRVESPAGIRVSTISPGVTESELADSISDPVAREAMVAYRAHAIPASSIAGAVAFSIDQPGDVDVNEIIVRPAAQR